MPVEDDRAAAAAPAQGADHVFPTRQRLEAVDLHAELGEVRGHGGLAGCFAGPAFLLPFGGGEQLRVLGAAGDELAQQLDEVSATSLHCVEDGLAH
jgi:hypothetical protein